MTVGCGLLPPWLASPGNTFQNPATAGNRHTEILRVVNDAETRRRCALNDADLESIDDDMDAYLAAAGIPPTPRDYSWFIRRPAKCSTDAAFWTVINQGIRDAVPEAVHALEFRLALDLSGDSHY